MLKGFLCSWLGLLFRITLPLSVPGLVVTAILSFLVAWDEFLFAVLLLTSNSKWLLSNGLSRFISEYTTPWDWVIASAVVYTETAVVFFLFLERYLVRGSIRGAVKN